MARLEFLSIFDSRYEQKTPGGKWRACECAGTKLRMIGKVHVLES